MSHAILCRGEPVYCEAVVKPWCETGLHFSARGKRTETRCVVWHHTGGEGGGEQVHRVLTSRGLSVHFLVDQHGVIWQYADASDYCSHAGSANGYSVGVEIANRANGVGAHPKFPRQVIQDRIHGNVATMTRFLEAQVTASLALARSLSKAFGLPLNVPRTDDGSEVFSKTLDGKTLREFRGHIGHFHVTTRKVDPGTELLREFAKSWSSDCA